MLVSVCMRRGVVKEGERRELDSVGYIGNQLEAINVTRNRLSFLIVCLIAHPVAFWVYVLMDKMMKNYKMRRDKCDQMVFDAD